MTYLTETVTIQVTANPPELIKGRKDKMYLHFGRYVRSLKTC